ncbi:copper resistance system multicopper oxidase [Psychromonas hadalis]|uniref:copper resistance system multicopper oxidase n=1 Tax=Psychromonas hadalis TaxID=211669 RepID=UPI0003B649AB|nr:copper resistance system multicopper oxidase [Psychromonas hadalis]
MSHNIAECDTARRQFMKKTLTGGSLLAVATLIPIAKANNDDVKQKDEKKSVLTGNEFFLTIVESKVNFTGNTRVATTVNGLLPGPTLRMKEGDTITVHVRNELDEDTSIHWHGIILPYQMDGVPGISFTGIKAGQTFTYQFTLAQSGTYWYHSHSAFQEITGLYGALVIEPAEQVEPVMAEQVIVLSDWTDENPMRVFGKLKTQSDYYNYNQATFFDFMSDVSKVGIGGAVSKRKMWNEMRMSPTDLGDLSAATLTFLMNGKTADDNWSGLFKAGEKLRLRFINGAGNSFFDVRIPGLKMTVVGADGGDLEPVEVDEFRFGPGETYDVIIEPTESVYTLFAQSMERSGYVRGTLAIKAGLNAPVPEVDAVQPLTMGDMMGGMDMSNDMSAMDHSAMDMSGDMSAMTMNMPGDMNAMTMEMSGDMSAMDMPNARSKASQTVRHAQQEYGASVDARVDTPRITLDDPGVGLRNNGRRVLTLADLKSKGGEIDTRPVDRELELHLTGNMERYTWSFDGVEFGSSTPIHLNYGERVRIILHNDTMMTHPMHLHGMWSDLEDSDGNFLARRHTIPIQPAQRVSFLVTVDARGQWAWHCHLLFHMEAGMFRKVVVS